MDKVLDYIISLTHLHGLVQVDKVVEIYNMQNDEEIGAKDVGVLSVANRKYLEKNFVKAHGDYFVAESILDNDEFDHQLRQRRGKPLYIPEYEELMKYRKEGYYEITKEYIAFLDYAAENFFDGDRKAADILCDYIQGICQFTFSMQMISEAFEERGIKFSSVEQINEMMQLVMDLKNNTRIWENNGYTPKEIFELSEKHNLRPLPKVDFAGRDVSNLVSFPSGKKIGRNDPCPCGSGKKYKKCCLGMD